MCMEERILIQPGALEGILSYPEENEPACAVLILTPHPHMGGNMENNVVRHLARRAAEEGAITLRFNYRGVGNSPLHLPQGISAYDYFADMETRRAYGPLLKDALAAQAWFAEANQGIATAVVIGYSLGAVLAGMLPHDSGYRRLIAISPPNRRVSMDCFKSNPHNKVFLGGGNDFAFNLPEFENNMADFAGENTFLPLPEGDHFFRGEEEPLYQILKPFLFGPEEESA
jgi:uncharacterized protein